MPKPRIIKVKLESNRKTGQNVRKPITKKGK